MTVTPLTAAVLAAVRDADLGEASAINDAASRVGGLIVIALVPALIGATAGRSLDHALVHGYQPAMIALGESAYLLHSSPRCSSGTTERPPRGSLPRRETTAAPCLSETRRRQRDPLTSRTSGGIMSTAPTVFLKHREPELLGQTIFVIGGSAGIGLETARRARAEGADVILTGRSPERLEHAALDVDAAHTTAFDANDPAALERFFEDPPTQSIM